MLKSDFEYHLPDERIATHPLAERDQSKLLVFDGEIQDRTFAELPEILPAGSQLIFNNTKVIKARLHFTKTEGAKPIEVFCLTPHNQSVEEAMEARGEVLFECMVGNLKRWKNHELRMELGPGLWLEARNRGRLGDIFVIHFTFPEAHTFSHILEEAGKIPLPPYMNRAAEASDEDRYQTVYAHTSGSVAAPTAGLHFTPRVFENLEHHGHRSFELTLHVGAGTFRPLSDGAVDAHEMHAEEILLSRSWLEAYLEHKGKKFAVGTTSLRTLESAHWMGVKLIQHGQLEPLNQFDAYSLDSGIHVREAFEVLLSYLKREGLEQIALHTQLMIRPGYVMKTVHGIITNFHQPGSTLLLLVSAGIGNRWKNIYEFALNNGYRFLSYGDSSLLYFTQSDA